MNRKIVIITLVCVALALVVGLLLFASQNSPEDLIEYPLDMVNVSDNSEYMVIIIGPGQTCDVATDTQAIKDNKSLFSVVNDSTIYNSSYDGNIQLYKDGVCISSFPADSVLTKSIEFGSLQFQETNQLQYLLLLGAEISEEGPNHSILLSEQDYYFFAHGSDRTALDTVYYLDHAQLKRELPVFNDINTDVIEFVKYSLDYSDLTRHWYFSKSDNKLSPSYWNVKDRKDNLILYPANERNGGNSRIIIHDMFDSSVDYHEITGDFPTPRNIDFLIAANFSADGSIFAKYTGTDGQEHEQTFPIP